MENSVAVDILQKLEFPDGLYPHEACAEFYKLNSLDVSAASQLCTKVGQSCHICYVKCVSKVLGQLSDSRTSSIASVTIIRGPVT